MLKKENRIYWYLLGCLIMFVIIFLLARDFVWPILKGERTLVWNEPFVYSKAPSFSLDTKSDYYARFITNKGIIIVDLFETSTPQNVNNFVFLSNAGYYTNTKFHRLIKDFLVQGGDRNTLDEDPANDGRGGPGYFVHDEVNWDSLDFTEDKRTELKNKGYSSIPNLESQPLQRFSLAMASSLPDTNGSQFFFVLADQDDARLNSLTGYFTVIGAVQSGAETLDNIAETPVDDAASDNPRPTEPLILHAVQIYTR